MPSGGGGSSPNPQGTTTTVQKADPWSGQQPFLSDVMGQAQGLNQNYSPSYFPNSTVAGFTAPQQQAQAAEIAQGTSGTPQVNAADQNSALTSSGYFLGAGNPYFQQMADKVTASALPALTSTFNMGNRINSPGAAYGVSAGLGDAIGALGYQNYSDERTNQLRAQGLAPSLQGADYQNIGAVADAGAQQQQQTQASINDQIQRFNFQQQLPYNKLGLYNQMIQGNYGGTSTLTQPYFGPASGSNLAGGLSGAATGAGLGTMIMPGFGTAGGAILGGLFGGGAF